MTAMRGIDGRSLRTVVRLVADDRGSTATEYAVVAGFIAVVIAGSVALVGQTLLTEYYEKIAAAFSG